MTRMRSGITALALAGCLPMAGGCATKGFVRDRIAEMDSRNAGEHARLGGEVARSADSAAEASRQAGAARDLALGNLDYRELQEFVVHFAFDSAELSPEAQGTLDDAVAMAKSEPRVLVDVLGHADSTGPDAYNDDLSRRRAAAVTQYLVLHGPGPVSRYALVGLGETSPVLAAGAEDRSASRRVVVSLLERTEPGSGPQGSPAVISKADARESR